MSLRRVLCPRSVSPKSSCSVIFSPLLHFTSSKCEFFTPKTLKRHASQSAPPLRPLKGGSSILSKPRNPRKTIEELYFKFEQEISNNKEGTKLYAATAIGSYVFTTSTTAAFCFLYAGWNFYTTSVDPLVELNRFITYAMGGICVAMGAMGAVFIRRGTGLITRITAIPASRRTPEIRINVRRFFGFLKPREIVTTPSQISLSEPIFVSKQQLRVQDMRHIRRVFHERAAGPRLSFWKSPLKKISYVMWKTFMNMRRVFTQEGFVYIEVKGVSSTLRLDITGYFADEFLAFERCLAEETS
ncbi:uncharacterized protein PADG_04164 [Paracoccidioides brasiliensis Pb18]|uniref:Uncharacterized protein n=1 Tax=Paracoccidioides brasiliensis (strain Pb18) TaxID=502780 RepID=C1GA78_PARBD|nr:uncharacterized protein PADG_04164 [Paracoccidioides brasiliensis Pb18]EEH48080.1 hypothetical protein PADG_04164 [Paracoccidioides brasiliensis Pb18]